MEIAILSPDWTTHLIEGVFPKPIQERFWGLENQSLCSAESLKTSGVAIADPKQPEL
jgi:hypothetical protein